MTTPMTGGCACGAIRYEYSGDPITGLIATAGTASRRLEVRMARCLLYTKNLFVYSAANQSITKKHRTQGIQYIEDSALSADHPYACLNLSVPS